MSEATPSAAKSPQPTSQQLDDLQALMERMLALPVNSFDKDAGGDFPTLFAAEPVPRATYPDSAPGTEQTAVAARTLETLRDPRVDGPPRGLRLAVRSSEAGPDQASETESAPNRAVPNSLVDRFYPPRASGALLRPLVWCNRVFDRTMARLGRPGRWLRGSTGRTVLGWVGLLCLAGAVTLGILDALGWTR